MRRRLGAALALPVLLALLGCGSSPDPAEVKSAAQTARAVEVLRLAPNAAKAAALTSLAALGCTGAEVCATRDACTAAYRVHVEGLSLTEAAKQQLGDGKGDAAAGLLGAAEQKLAQAQALVVSCTDREAALRRRFKL